MLELKIYEKETFIPINRVFRRGQSNQINKQNNAPKYKNSDKANKLRIMLRQQKTIFKSTPEYPAWKYGLHI